MGDQLATIIVAIAGSTAVFSFLQFLIQRRDTNSNQLKEIMKRMDALEDNVNQCHVVDARIRILQASDEMRRDVRHSEEFFDQLHEDITMYENYCRDHPEFRNNKSTHAIDNINRVYQECLRKDLFL